MGRTRGMNTGRKTSRARRREIMRAQRGKRYTKWFTICGVQVIVNRMVEFSGRLDAVFHALSDPTRRAMLGQLSERDRSIGELATPFRMTLAGASKHVRVLERAGLVTRMIRGRIHRCRLQAGRLAEADAWLKQYEGFWSGSLENLDVILREEDRKSTAAKEG